MSVIDVYLIIRYEGLKSTQYFSKFTAESVNELKKDLVEMGLPHPKRENIQLLSHGTLECRWQTTPNNHILLNNLKAKTRQTPEIQEKWKELSIANITWKELYVGNEKKKRPFAQFQSDANTRDRTLPTGPGLRQRLLTPPDNINSRSGSFRPNASYDGATSSSNNTELGFTNKWPTRSSNSSNGDEQHRPSKIQKVTSGDFQPSTKSTLPISFNTPQSENQPSLDGSNQKVMRAKAEDQVVDDFLKNLPFLGAEASGNEASKMPVHPQSENLSDFVSRGRSSIRDAESARQNSLKTDPPELIDVDNFEDIPGLNSRAQISHRNLAPVMDSVLPTPPSSGSLAHKSRVEVNNVSPNKPFRAPLSVQSPNQPSVTAESIRRNSFGFRNPPTGPALRKRSPLPTTKARPRSADPGDRRPIHSPTRPFMATDATRIPSSSSQNPDVRQLMRESFDLKREIQALVVKYSTVSRQLQSLDSSWVPEPLQFGPDALVGNIGNAQNKERVQIDRSIERLKIQIEDLQHDLRRSRDEQIVDRKDIEVERSQRSDAIRKLEEERKLREEAENALADVRRECRHPFVVPTLLDAFVQVSKLTTRGLKYHPPEATALVSNGSIDSGSRRTDRGVDSSMARPELNGVDSSSRLGITSGELSKARVDAPSRPMSTYTESAPLKLSGTYPEESPSRSYGDRPSSRPSAAYSDAPYSRSGMNHHEAPASKRFPEKPSPRTPSGPSYSRMAPYTNGHTPRNGSFGEREYGRGRDSDRERQTYNGERERVDPMNSRQAMPPPRLPSPARSFDQGKTQRFRRSSEVAPYPPRRPVVKMEPRDDVIVL